MDHSWYTQETVEHEKPISIAVLDTNRWTWHLLPYPVQKALTFYEFPISASEWHTYTIHVSIVSRLKNPSLTCIHPLHLHWLKWIEQVISIRDRSFLLDSSGQSVSWKEVLFMFCILSVVCWLKCFRLVGHVQVDPGGDSLVISRLDTVGFGIRP